MLVEIIAAIAAATSPDVAPPQEWPGWVSLATSSSTFGLLVWLITVGQPKAQADANATILSITKEFRDALRENREELKEAIEKMQAGEERNRQMYERHLEKFAALLEMRGNRATT